MKKRSIYAPSAQMVERAAYIGKAGEHLVLSALLFRQFDAALVEIDSGTDILMEKGGRLFRVQVKTRTVGRDENSSFILGEKKFKGKNIPDFFVIVLIDIDKTDHIEMLIIPRRDMLRMKQSGLLRKQKNHGRYYAALSRRNSHWFIKNRQHDITHFLNAFDLIK